MTKTTSNPVTQGLENELASIWRFALYLTHDNDDAEDLFQKTCLRALEKRNQYRDTGQLRSWCFRICQNIWRNEIRARAIRLNKGFVEGHHEDSRDASMSDSGRDLPDSILHIDQVFEAVEKLPEAQRMVVILVCVEGFTYRDSAAILDVPIGTVMSRLARARLTLGEKFIESRSTADNLCHEIPAAQVTKS